MTESTETTETTDATGAVASAPARIDEPLYSASRRLRELHDIRHHADVQIDRLAREVHMLPPRTPVECLRCGYSWTPYDPFSPPICCARCGSLAWDLPPTARSRKPSDPPAKSWRIRKGYRRAKFGDAVSRYRGREIKRTRPVPPDPAPPPWELAARILPTINLTIAELPPPPEIDSPLPPPPALTPTRFAHLAASESPVQPEMIASHPAPELNEKHYEVNVIVTPGDDGDPTKVELEYPETSEEEEPPVWPTTHPE